MEPPSRYICPVSRGVMHNPILVVHGGHPYWFDASSLSAHSKTRFGDKNPLTNMPGFRDARKTRDDGLRKEIQDSMWKPQEDDDEEVEIIEDPPNENADVMISLIDEIGEVFAGGINASTPTNVHMIVLNTFNLLASDLVPPATLWRRVIFEILSEE